MHWHRVMSSNRWRHRPKERSGNTKRSGRGQVARGRQRRPPSLTSLSPEQTALDVGTEVRLHGADFQAGAAVYFSDRLAQLAKVEDADSILVLAPLQPTVWSMSGSSIQMSRVTV